MKKNKILSMLFLALVSLSLIPIKAIADNNVELYYSLPETEGQAIFHLNTTLVTYTPDELEKNINYYITTQAGNYYIGNGYKEYSVYIPDDILTDTHGNDTTLNVNFNCNQAQGILNLNNSVNDNLTYSGNIISTTESTTIAGTYRNSVMVEFILGDKLTKLATNEYSIHRGVTAETNYVEVPGIQTGTTVSELRDNFLNKDGDINVYDTMGNLVEDENAIVTTAMTVQLENVITGVSTFNLKRTATVNDSLGIVIPGDVDGDGEITGEDLGIIKDWILRGKENWMYFEAADMNNDGNITVADATLVSKYYYGSHSAEVDQPYLFNTSYKENTYNGLNYIKMEAGKHKMFELQNVLMVNENQYLLDENGVMIPNENNEYIIYEVVNYDNEGNIMNKSDYNAFELLTMKYKTGYSTKILEARYDSEYNFISYNNTVYDMITYIIDGDINSDGLVNENDEAMLEQFISGEDVPTTIQKLAADRNNDGIINQSDLDIYNN